MRCRPPCKGRRNWDIEPQRGGGWAAPPVMPESSPSLPFRNAGGGRDEEGFGFTIRLWCQRSENAFSQQPRLQTGSKNYTGFWTTERDADHRAALRRAENGLATHPQDAPARLLPRCHALQ